MTELKGIFVNDNFGNILYDLFSKNYEYIADDYLYDYVLDIKEMSISDIKEVFEIGDCLVFILECSRDLFHFYYEFKFHRDVHKVYLNCYSKLPYENDDDLVLLNGYCVSFDDKLIDSLFNLPQKIEEKTTSEPEQPAEDAEEQENPEQTPAEDAEEPEEEECWSVECSNRTNGKIELTLGSGNNAIKKYYSSYDEMYEDNPEYKESFFNVLSINARLTPLERVVFEEIENCYERYNDYAELARTAEYGAEYNGEPPEEIDRYGHLANEQIFNSDYLKELISKAGLDETYQAWLAERKKQEAVGASH